MSTHPIHRHRAVRLAAVALMASGIGGLTAFTVAATEAHAAQVPSSTSEPFAPGTPVTLTTSPPEDLDPAAYGRQIKAWINQARRDEGLTAVQVDACAEGAADRWSGFLAVNRAFVHQDLQPLMDSCGAVYASEALGRGAIDPHAMVDLWLRSPEHQGILLDPRPGRIGVGAHLDQDGQWVVTVVLLGR